MTRIAHCSMYELENYYKVIIAVLRNISEVSLKVLFFNNLKIVLSGKYDKKYKALLIQIKKKNSFNNLNFVKSILIGPNSIHSINPTYLN